MALMALELPACGQAGRQHQVGQASGLGGQNLSATLGWCLVSAAPEPGSLPLTRACQVLWGRDPLLEPPARRMHRR